MKTKFTFILILSGIFVYSCAKKDTSEEPSGTAPVAKFTSNKVIITQGESIIFTDQSTGTITNWSWMFEGGTPQGSSIKNPANIVYNQTGKFFVQLYVSNQYGSNTKIEQNYITVNEPVILPSADFTANVNSIYMGENVNFTDQSSGNPTAWSWSFTGGDPSNSTLQNPTQIIYSTPGVYDVILTATNKFGSNTMTKNALITVKNPPPNVNFTASKTVLYRGDTINFTDNSSGNPTSWEWTFTGGDPGTSNVQNPSGIIYQAIGFFDVTLKATNVNGSSSKTKSKYIRVITHPVIYNPMISYGSYTDSRDNRTYNTVTIGSQTWMAENLQYNASGSTYYGNNSSNAMYGRLYDWYTALYAAPSGWHLPSIAEWETLYTELGGADIAGGKLKETTCYHWYAPNDGADNSSGFTALPAGNRDGNGFYGDLGYYTDFWTSEGSGTHSWAYRLFYNGRTIHQYGYYKEACLSIRCVQD